jgi:ubiquinone/menaquinone biosynthesis C-methylase UbiE
VPDPIFADPRLAAVYDQFDGARDDLAVYVALLCELGATRVADVGCGTGSLAVRLADGGYRVVGVDPAEASLSVARAKDPSGRVEWIHGDASELPAAGFDVALMTGNVAQVFLTDDDWNRALDGVHRALRPGGHFVFETRRPQRRAWEDWAREQDCRTLDIGGVGRVEQRFSLTQVRLPLVSFRFTYRFLADDTVITSDSTLCFRDRDEIEAGLAAAGFQVNDVREAPDRPGREFVFITRAVRPL